MRIKCCRKLLLIIIFLIFLLLIIVLQSLKYIDLCFIFRNTDGNIDWSIIWSAIGALGSFAVGVLSYMLTRILKNIEIKRHEAETKPFVMLSNWSISTYIGHEKLQKESSLIFLTKRCDLIDENIPKSVIKFELTNTSGTFVEVLFYMLKTIEETEDYLECLGSKFGTNNNNLYISPLQHQDFGIVINANKIHEIIRKRAVLKLNLRNNFAETYRLHIYFLIVTANHENIMLSINKYEIEKFEYFGDKPTLKRLKDI